MNGLSRLGAHPESLIMWASDQGRRTGMLWFPVFNLVWLYWMAAAPWLITDTPPLSMIVLTCLSLGLFLVLYQRAWFGSRTWLPHCTVAISVLGLAIIPVNSSWSYVVYAGSLLPFCWSGWRPVAALAALLSMFLLTAVASSFYIPALALMATITLVSVAGVNFFLRNIFVHHEAMRTSEGEMRRLAVIAERERIGRDLHDLLGHTLSLVAVKSALARRVLHADPAAADGELADIEHVARQSLAQVREAVTGMRAVALAAEVASARLMLEAVDIQFEFKGAELALGNLAEAALAMGLREAVTNVQRHAHATRVEVQLRVDPELAELSVRDNGRGGVIARGNGLNGMEQRLAALGGQLLLESTPGSGTLLRMRVPAIAGPA
jgi:two-component system, NarL family, sensor histidine kinase DesK